MTKPELTPFSGGPLIFGIYPAQQIGEVSGAPDDPAAIRHALTHLSGQRPFLVREYIHFRGKQPPEIAPLTLPDDFYAQPHVLLDLVLCYLPAQQNLPGWLNFINQAVERYGHLLHSLQITLEPNFDMPGIDGSSPGVRQALTLGLPHARKELKKRGLEKVQLGFSVAEPPEWKGGDGNFWAEVWRLGGPSFVEALDYLGLALYPDAFSPVAPAEAPGDTASLVIAALRTLRETSMPQAHLPATLPIRIAETGSPTADRSEQAQAASLETIIRTVYAQRQQWNVTALEWFGLRDANSAVHEPFYQFGLLRDNYAPKQAFDRYRELIAELGEQEGAVRAAPIEMPAADQKPKR